MAKWKFQLTDEGIRFYYKAMYRGEILIRTDKEIYKKREFATFLLRIINSYIEEKQDE